MLRDRKYRKLGGLGGSVTQLCYAREGVVTEETRCVAEREKMNSETIREEVARGHMLIPANVNHHSLALMCIGKVACVKINTNLGNWQTTSEIQAGIQKLRTSVKYGAGTMMDLSSDGDLPRIRRAIIELSPAPVGALPIYEIISRIKSPEEMGADLFLEVIEEQAEQGVDYLTILEEVP